MPSQDTEPEPNQLQFLLDRYSQLNQRHNTNNQIVHTTFYLSVVFFGILLGGVPQISERRFRLALYIFAGFIFMAMFLWTRTYLNGRDEIARQKEAVLRELEATEYSFNHIDSIRQLFTDDDYRDFWETSEIKDQLLQIYYLVLAGLSVTIPLI